MTDHRSRLLAGAAAIVLSGFAAQPAFAQDALDAAQAEQAPDASTIVVIGTRRTDRTVTDSPSPVDVIGSEELVGQATANVMDAVRNVVPSFFVGQNTISDASTFVRSPSLRGLPGDETLVMINGKRFNRSSLVQVYAGGDTALSFGSQAPDISSIPSMAIGNLQVLREGATAQYGSDAIAGVFNFGLKNQPGLEMQAKYGQYYEGDGESWQLAGYGGVAIGDTGYLSVTAEYTDDKGTSRGAQRPSAVYFTQTFPTLATQLPNYPGPVQIWGSSPRHAFKAVVNAGFDVSDAVQWYAFGNYGDSHADQSFNYREFAAWSAERFNGTSTSVGGGNANSAFAHPVYLTPCPANNATCPAGAFVKDTNVYNFTSLYPAGFTPRFVGDSQELFGSTGVKGENGPFAWDVSATYGRHTLDLSMYNSLSPSYGPQSQTSFEFGRLIQRELNFNLDTTYEIDAGMASPLTLSGGLEWRRETYEATPGDTQSYGVGPFALQRLYVQTAPGVYAFDSTVTMSPGASGYAGTNPVAAGSFSQRSWAGYVGLEGDITPELSFGVAGRYEHYNTFGSATVGKVNAIYHISPAFAVRGTVGTGFHAPSPGQSNVQILTTSFVQGNAVQVGTYPVGSAIAQYYGAKPLTPEESTNFGFGFVIDPGSDLNLTIDAYSIKVRNRIGISQSFTVSQADINAQPSLLAVGVGGRVQYFTNGFDTRTQGVDVVGTYRTQLAGGPLNLTLAYNYNKSKVTDFDPGVIGPTQLIDIQYLAPNHRATLSANWQLGDFALNLRESYYGEWRDANDYPIRAGNVSTGAIIDGQHFGAKFTTDIELSYTLMDHYTLSVGANNLFDEYPDKIIATVNNPIYTSTGSISNGSVYPRPGGPFGINGGFWYVKLGVKY
ncbi:TonB-dependent receptor [Tsuneonella sp. YG55]|uniref:TonB-dependent receptor n=1 Tax=Tsuneonella litorea TaxID=2976475 RepID=A0A9X3A8Z2_9SPHN|nr:TonB-dependent receptor [Tsuneonella litorea]MCT2559951.1 TonB-dependent receptor [Tsuneonella litorea]